MPRKLLLGVGALALVVAGWFALRGSPMEEQHAKERAVKELRPAVDKLLSGRILAKPRQLTWDGQPRLGMDEAAAPIVAVLSPGRSSLRVVDQGTLDVGARVVLDASYSRPGKRFTLVRLTLTFPGERHQAIGNVPITADYLARHGVAPSLVAALIKGIGKGSTGTSSNHQAQAELDGKSFEATTAIYTGPNETSLTLICSYLIRSDGGTEPFG